MAALSAITGPRFVVALCLVALSVGAAFGQAEPPPPPPPPPATLTVTEVLTNATIQQMVSAGFSDSLIVDKIQASACQFDTTVAALTALKDAGVPPTVLSAMIQKAPAAPERPIDPNDPLQPHPAGVYVMQHGEGGARMQALPFAVYSASKVSNIFGFAITVGMAKLKMKAVLAGEHGRYVTDNRRPEFYFYFEETQAGLSRTTPGVSVSPNEFVLAVMDIRKGERLLVVGEASLFAARQGVAGKASREFQFEKLGEGIYKVWPTEPLAPGEYCFFYGGKVPLAYYGSFSPNGGGRVIDFRIEGPPEVPPKR